jgi:lipopolysaccharide export LptBFGC system permease protein LptF
MHLWHCAVLYGKIVGGSLAFVLAITGFVQYLIWLESLQRAGRLSKIRHFVYAFTPVILALAVGRGDLLFWGCPVGS